ncbi:hypothetical protein AU195_11025 [Mycobacterium sp. IS-1496]|nr:hypothetical protein AU195_11025 [Mycobacterium sp. IS-1496]
MDAAVLIGSAVLVVAVLSAGGFAWHRRRAGRLTAHERYQRDISYLWSDREVLRARRRARARNNGGFWAAGAAGAAGAYYLDGDDGGGDGGGCGGGGCGGGGS